MNNDFEEKINNIIIQLKILKEMEGDKTDFIRLCNEVLQILDEKLKLNSLINDN